MPNTTNTTNTLTFYFEVLRKITIGPSRLHVLPGIYSVKANVTNGDRYHLYQACPAQLIYTANRVWQETVNGKISYIKHRGEDKVDKKEFSWIKLQAKTL